MSQLISVCADCVLVAEREVVLSLGYDGNILSQVSLLKKVCCLTADGAIRRLAVAIEKEGNAKDENVFVYEMDGAGSLTRLFGLTLPHEATQMQFANYRGQQSLFVLNSGDLDCINLASETLKGILGSIAAGTSFAINQSGKHIVTADRDGKIRISNYPDTYNIRAYAFLHEEFVPGLAFLDEATFLSSDGNGVIARWNIDGSLVKSEQLFDCGATIRQLSVIDPSMVAAITQGKKSVYIIDTATLTITQEIPLPSEPISIDLSNDGTIWILASQAVYRVSQNDRTVQTIREVDRGAAVDYSLERHRVKSKKVIKRGDRNSEAYMAWRNPEKTHKDI
jgi:WD40 repeat protein